MDFSAQHTTAVTEKAYNRKQTEKTNKIMCTSVITR